VTKIIQQIKTLSVQKPNTILSKKIAISLGYNLQLQKQLMIMFFGLLYRKLPLNAEKILSVVEFLIAFEFGNNQILMNLYDENCIKLHQIATKYTE
jgi:hypothetical protein